MEKKFECRDLPNLRAFWHSGTIKMPTKGAKTISFLSNSLPKQIHFRLRHETKTHVGGRGELRVANPENFQNQEQFVGFSQLSEIRRMDQNQRFLKVKDLCD